MQTSKRVILESSQPADLIAQYFTPPQGNWGVVNLITAAPLEALPVHLVRIGVLSEVTVWKLTPVPIDS
jgi:hypothetical protein